MSISVESGISEELDIPEEEEEPYFNLGLYIGCRNEAGQRHGRGWAILPNGDQYDGQYRKGKRHGFGLYVWKGGHRYYGQYRCGNRSGRGMFIYPDGTMYEGGWRKSMRHGKGRYNYSNGDTYTGDWYYGQRHGVGIYTFKAEEGCTAIRFKGTWREDVRLGPFQVYFGCEERCIVLHGSWDNLYPTGPAVFTFDQRYMLMGFFQSPPLRMSYMPNVEEYYEGEQNDEFNTMNPQPPEWFSQDICPYDYSQLPQEPVPLPLSDSDLSVCTLSTVPSIPSTEQSIVCIDEGEDEGEEGECECIPECEGTSDIESSSEPCRAQGDPCAIEIMNAIKCDPPPTI